VPFLISAQASDFCLSFRVSHLDVLSAVDHRNPRALAFVVLEIFNLFQALFRFRLGFVGPAEIFPLLGQHFVTFFYFFDHDSPLYSILRDPAQESMKEGL